MSIDDQIDGGIYAMGVRDGKSESLEIIVAKDKEIETLKAENKSWKEAHDNLAMQLTIQSNEVERLCGGIQDAIDLIRPIALHIAFDNAKRAQANLESLLSPADEPKPLDSPAPVTESPCRMCLRIKSTIEGYCGVCDRHFSPSGGKFETQGKDDA